MIGVTVGGLVLMGLSIAVTLAMTAASARPDMALRVWPAAAKAKAAIAWQLVSTPSSTPERRALATTLAGAALSREPVLASAASTLGTIRSLAGSATSPNAAFAYAERLSRRDLPTQLWFIERAVERNDVAGALHHYDVALRTKPTSAGLLLPVLAGASDTPEVRRELLARLRGRPSWRLGYFQTLLARPPSPAALADQLAHAGLDPAQPADLTILSDGLTSLVRMKQYALAVSALPAADRRGALRNGGFERPPTLLPFDWWLSSDGDLLADRDPARIGAGAYVLRIASSERGGPVARQLVMLPAGRFVLEGLVGVDAASTASPLVTIDCDGADPRASLTPTVPPDGAAHRFALAFTVPEHGCDAQRITIAVPPTASVLAWIDALRLRPAG